jgi:phosphoenolpyruvate synthase/pyruvate phosphate dikinase
MNLAEVNKYISNMIAKGDWFFRSIADQAEVKDNKMSFTEYIKKYGLRADKDYEIASPRWYEMQEKIKKRIENNSGNRPSQNVALDVDGKLQKIIDASISLQLLRSESKRKALVHINHLREAILKVTGGKTDISTITKQQLLNGKFVEEPQTENGTEKKKIINTSSILSGMGVSVSQGEATGLTKHILDNDMDVPKGTIGIFPNASPEFAIQYPKCNGMIFLKGGQTSHGAIVAREFGIPAVIDSKAQDISDNSKIELNGTTGKWQIL